MKTIKYKSIIFSILLLIYLIVFNVIRGKITAATLKKNIILFSVDIHKTTEKENNNSNKKTI